MASLRAYPLAFSQNTTLYINIFLFHCRHSSFKTLVFRTLKQLIFVTASQQMVQLVLRECKQESLRDNCCALLCPSQEVLITSEMSS
jgi:hypothetical protein